MAYKNTNKNKDKYPWMGQRFRDGKKQRKVFLTRREALLWESQEEDGEEKAKGPVAEPTLSVSLQTWANEYLEYSENKFVRKTLNEKVLSFKFFFKFARLLPSDPVEKLSPYIAVGTLQKISVTRSGGAANKYKKNLSAAWEWGSKFLDMPKKNPFSDVDKFASARNERRVPTLDDFWKAYHATLNEKDKAMLYCYLQTGARMDELFRLKWQDVDFFGKRVRLSWRKNKAGEWKSQWLNVRDDLMTVLLKLRKKALTDLVFPSKTGLQYVTRVKWLDELCQRAGVEKFGFHGIRHLFASILAAQNVPLVEIQFMLRHSRLATTERYIHRLKKENREVLEALPGMPVSEKSTSKVHQNAKSVIA